jgi:transcriptional regulator with XRE-family HTH domain
MSQSELLRRIAERCAAIGLTERQAVMAAGINLDFVRDIRRRGHSPKVDKLAKLAKALRTPLSYFTDAIVPASDGGEPEAEAAVPPDATELRELSKIGQRITWAREANEFALDQVRAQLRFRDGELEAIEEGRRPPSVFQLLQLSYALHVSADYLLRGYLTARTHQAVGNILLWRGQAEPEPGMEVPHKEPGTGKLQPSGKSRRPKAAATAD